MTTSPFSIISRHSFFSAAIFVSFMNKSTICGANAFLIPKVKKNNYQENFWHKYFKKLLAESFDLFHEFIPRNIPTPVAIEHAKPFPQRLDLRVFESSAVRDTGYRDFVCFFGISDVSIGCGVSHIVWKNEKLLLLPVDCQNRNSQPVINFSPPRIWAWKEVQYHQMSRKLFSCLDKKWRKEKKQILNLLL